jgi:8-oxo-dGTP pyrophosphatase MutT (NUDIX family)
MTVSDTPSRWPVVSSSEKLRDWLITVRTDEVRMPGDGIAKRTVVTHPGAVGVVALDPEDRVLMIRQYRHPVGGLLWELPAGLLDHSGEAPVEAARRELREETGYAAASWEPLVDYYSSPGFSTERIQVFLARDLSELADRGYSPVDEEATLEVRWVPLREAVATVLSGGIHNGLAIIGILAARAALSDIVPLWQGGTVDDGSIDDTGGRDPR